jgi:hypothetical protein
VRDGPETPDTARNEKLIGAPLEARAPLRRRELFTPQQYAAQLPALFIVSQVEVERTEPDELADRGTRGGDNASAAGNIPRRRVRRRIPDDQAPCAAAVHEILNG